MTWYDEGEDRQAWRYEAVVPAAGWFSSTTKILRRRKQRIA
jgi:hypothetical protein